VITKAGLTVINYKKMVSDIY